MKREMEEKTTTRSELWRGRLRRLRSGARKAFPFVAGVLAAFIGLFLYNLAFPGPKPLSTQDVSDTVNKVLASATPMPAYSELVYQVIQPSLVLIQTKVTGKDGKEGNGLGSGVVVDDMGDILTSLHVVDGASEIQITFADGTKSGAQITTSQPDHDIAVLRADKPPAKLYPATLGNPNSMQVGDEAYAFGNPFGLYGSMSAGIISGFDRSFQPTNAPQKLTGLIQIDAAVNPGNSGGPLLDSAGRVIGVNTAILSPSGAYAGIGFAVPIDAINRVVPQIIRTGAATRPGFGISIAQDQVTKRLGLEGVLILSVTQDSAAQRAGLRPTTRDENGQIVPGDIIVGIDGKQIKGTGDLFRILDNHDVGDILQLDIQRLGEGRITVDIQLQALP